MKFKETDKTYKSGSKKGQPVLVPDIKSYDDIPTDVNLYFSYCMDYLKETFGEENIVMAQVHYDEDTPHLQTYFLPIVNEVKRKYLRKIQLEILLKNYLILKIVKKNLFLN